MAELLGAGISHFPLLCHDDAAMAAALRWTLDDPQLPQSLRRPEGWPEAMRKEWGADQGVSAAASHRAALVEGLRRTRQAIDEFAPDALVVVGDDQYENFREDVVPPFAVLAYEDRKVHPWSAAEATRGVMPKTNVWGEDEDTTFLVRGRRDIALELTSGLLARDIDVSYAYESLHHPGLPHAFMNTVLFLDYDRRGFAYPVIPLALNCYGRRVVSRKGGLSRLGDHTAFDPPSPRPVRLFQLGRALAETIVESPWRIALVASSSWSHAFLCDRTWRLHPDTAADRELYGALQAGDWARWQAASLADIEDAGQQELLNWFVLAGAVDRVGARLRWSTFVETSIFNSNKVFAVFEPAAACAESQHL